MCGIVGSASKHRNVVPLLLEGLKRLEYRGYDSAGVAVLKQPEGLQVSRVLGKVESLEYLLEQDPMSGRTGLAHTRWATHGKPSLRNAHPHIAGNRVILVHNGIIENYESLSKKLKIKGYHFLSDTDSELVAWSIYDNLLKNPNFLVAVQNTVRELEGAYAIGVMETESPGRIIGIRQGPPLVVGIGVDEYFLASDVLALSPFTDQYIYLEDGDIVDFSYRHLTLYDKEEKLIKREVVTRKVENDLIDKGDYSHFMLKEIFEQPKAIIETLQGSVTETHVLPESFGLNALEIFDKVKQVKIVACGTSFYAGLVAKNWIEGIANIPCDVEIASEFRYRKKARQMRNSLYVSISQSGETADTIAAARSINIDEYSGSLAICNVPNSSLVREALLTFMTNAGPEIGVCSTKTFTTQLVALLLLSLVLSRNKRMTNEDEEKAIVSALKELPKKILEVLSLSNQISDMAKSFLHKEHALFLGRGLLYPIALEGALKLKEISYIHAEGYPAGELKHGPLALVDKEMPVIVVAPNNALLEKLKSNIQEVLARGGEVYVFAANSCNFIETESLHVIEMPEIEEELSPILYTIPLQLLAYHVAVLKGNDVDKPRNLAKSVTVE